jgi:hypothetical protein
MKFTLAIITAALLVPGSVPPVNADTHIPDVTWTTLYFRQGILVEKGTVADSPYHALRGTGIVQAGIGRVISILYEHNRAKEWVHQLVKSKGLRNDLLSSVVWQRYDIPWPAKDRDFVYLAEPAIDESRKFFQALMTDVTEINNRLTNAERTGLPNQSCCVRGKIVYGRWQFRPVEPGKTCARIDIMFDPKGRLPAFIDNQFQRDWPFATIEGLQAQALKQDITPHEIFGNWTGDLPITQIKQTECMAGQLDH